MQRVLQQPAFTVQDVTFGWGEVVVAAREWGEWSRLERVVEIGIELVDIAGRRGDAPTVDELQIGAGELRYELGLLSADETLEWLERWGLDLDGWFDYLRRSLLRAREARPVPQRGGRGPLEFETWTEAVCSGELTRWARTLADRAAVFAALGELPSVERLTDMESRYERFVAEATPREAVEAELAANALDWTRLDCAWVETANEAVAREAALCVTEDGREFDDVTRDAGLIGEHRRLYLGDLDAETAPHLIGVEAGSLLGPLVIGERFVLIQVHDRTTPSPDDRELCVRAERRLAERAVEREVLGRVGFRDPV